MGVSQEMLLLSITKISMDIIIKKNNFHLPRASDFIYNGVITEIDPPGKTLYLACFKCPIIIEINTQVPISGHCFIFWGTDILEYIKLLKLKTWKETSVNISYTSYGAYFLNRHRWSFDEKQHNFGAHMGILHHRNM